MLPTDGVSYKTVHRTFIQLQRAGIFDRIHKAVVRIYLTRRRPKYHATDTTYIKNVCGRDCLGRNPTDRGRKATKISSITDDLGATLTFTLFPGNRSDQIVLPDTLVGFDVPRGMELFADKGYDSRANRALVCAQGYRERIGKRGQKRGPNARRKRVIIEHSYAHLKQFRHLRNRYDHLATSYAAFVALACAIVIGNILTGQESKNRICRV
jgi:putative transposase